jgi:hypothetical protein
MCWLRLAQVHYDAASYGIRKLLAKYALGEQEFLLFIAQESRFDKDRWACRFPQHNIIVFPGSQISQPAGLDQALLDISR